MGGGPEIVNRTNLRQGRPDLDIRGWDPLEGDSADAALSGAAIVVIANDNPLLAPMLADIERLAPGALVFDVAGVLARDGVAAVRRFGEGRGGR